MVKVQLLDPEIVGEMFNIKKRILERIKELIKEAPIKNAEIKIFGCENGKLMTIRDVYVDPLNGKLTIRNDKYERMYVVDVLCESNENDLPEINLTMQELTSIIAFMENKINVRQEAIENIQETAKQIGMSIEIK